MVGVLVLVDQHVAEPAAVGLAHVRELLEQVHGEHEQVVEVEGVGLAQAALVLAYAADIDSSRPLRVSFAASSGSCSSFLALLTQFRTAPGG